MVYRWLRNAHDLLLPPICVLCGDGGERGRGLCAGCSHDLPRNHRACSRCALPLPEEADPALPCAACLRHPPPADGALAALRYEAPADFLIAGLKYRARLDYARILGELLADAVVAAGAARPDRLVPVPLHPRRLRGRGFNQALELARPVARRLGVGIERRGCRRRRDTPRQTGLDAHERRTNLRDAFTASDFAGCHVAIVDDVVTTGHTAAALTHALRRAGARRIEIWSAARAA